jgi:DNA polymerase-3 subunit epsilon
MIRSMREIVLDTETTGLNPADGHRLVEIGCIEIVHQIPTGQTFYTLINPERDVPEDAFRVHGHSTAALALQPVFAKVAPDLIAFIREDPLVIHNAEFDVRFINSELARLSLPPIAMSRVVDTLALARRRHPGAPNSLDALCDRYRIDRTRRVKHGALLDAEILVEIYGELLGGRQRAMIFAKPTADKRTPLPGATRPAERIGSVTGLITEAERAAHAEHIATFGPNAIWRRYEAAEPSN